MGVFAVRDAIGESAFPIGEVAHCYLLSVIFGKSPVGEIFGKRLLHPPYSDGGDHSISWRQVIVFTGNRASCFLFLSRTIFKPKKVLP